MKIGVPVLLLCFLSPVQWCQATQPRSWPVLLQCSSRSPGFIVDNEVLPWLHKTLDEVSAFTNALLDKINEGVAYLEPHVDRSPMPDMDHEKYFSEIKDSVNGYYQLVHDEVIMSWRNLTKLNEIIENSLASIENPYACVFAMGSVAGYHPFQNIFADIGRKFGKIHETHVNSSSVLLSVLEEISFSTHAIVINSAKIIMDSLNLEGLKKEDSQRLLQNNIAKMAPNFFGMLIRKMIKKGSDPSNYKKINYEVLRELHETRVMIEEPLYQLSQRCYRCPHMHEIYHNFWRTQASASVARTNERLVIPKDIAFHFQNEVYLSEIALSLMASFREPTENKQEEIRNYSSSSAV